MNNNKIGKFIARKRKEANLTQMELANKLYVTDKAVSKWERGLSLPDITLLKKLIVLIWQNFYCFFGNFLFAFDFVCDIIKKV